jgi:dTDP-4-dehydrorhamnose 3,5-epimerase-like enzyme
MGVPEPSATSPSILDFSCHRDVRGALVPVHLGDLPFEPARVFVVTDVPAGTTRGRHSHRVQRQVLTCVSGRIAVELRRPGAGVDHVRLGPGQGVLVEPGTWAAETYEAQGSVLLVMADGPYDTDELVHEPPDA